MAPAFVVLEGEGEKGSKIDGNDSDPELLPENGL